MSRDEVLKAMRDFSPVKYDGIIYARISARIHRVIKTRKGTYKEVFQLELTSMHGNSVTIAEMEKVELANEQTELIIN